MSHLFASKKRGFTLIEMLVVVSLFSLLLIVTSEILITFFNISKETKFSLEISQGLRYGLETINREARFAARLEPYVTDKSYYGNIEEASRYIPHDWDEDKASTIKITKSDSTVLIFLCKNNNGDFCTENSPGSIWQLSLNQGDLDFEESRLTSENILITKFEVDAEKTVSEDNYYKRQPMLSILVEARSSSQNNDAIVSTKMTTSKSSYDYSFVYPFKDISIAKVVSRGGISHVLATDGTLWSTGVNDNGSLGLGHRNTPVTRFARAALTGVKDISKNGGLLMAVKEDGTVWAVGSGAWYNYLSGSGNDAVPYENWTQVAYFSEGYEVMGFIEDAISISNGIYNTHIIRGPNREIWGSGVEGFGNLANGGSWHFHYNRFIRTEKRVDGANYPMTGAVQVDVSQNHSIALTDDGKVWITGCLNLGAGDTNSKCNNRGQSRWIEQEILSDKKIVKVGLTGYSSFAITSDGKFWHTTSSGWTLSNLNDVYDVSGGDRILGAGDSRMLMIKRDGSLFLGRPNNWEQYDNNYIKDVAIVGSWVPAVGPYIHMIAVESDGTVKTIGDNNYGQLGMGNTISYSTYKTRWQNPLINLGL